MLQRAAFLRFRRLQILLQTAAFLTLQRQRKNCKHTVHSSISEFSDVANTVRSGISEFSEAANAANASMRQSKRKAIICFDASLHGLRKRGAQPPLFANIMLE